MKNNKITEENFLDILEESKRRLLRQSISTVKSGDDFEAVHYKIIKEICLERGLQEDKDFYRTGRQTFPDVVIGSFGVEIKFTSGDAWVSTGNSITETTKVDGLKKIFMFFCKQGKKNKHAATYRPYEECLSEIVVTHSPRYKINMQQDVTDSIFSKMGLDYETFINSDSIKLVKDYYRSQLKPGEELWWIDSEAKPIIKNFNDLDESLQTRFKQEVMILFPEIFSSSNRKYLKPAVYLLQNYQAVCSSFRDLFSAAGREEIALLTKKKLKVPKIIYHLYMNSKGIRGLLAKMKINEKDWLDSLDSFNTFNEVKLVDVYKAGLRS